MPWLKGELEKLGADVIAPDFPTPGNQNLKSWLSVAERSFLPLREDDILVGHSIGCAFALHLLERSAVNVRACILVSSFLSFLRNRSFDHINQTFVRHTFDWRTMKTKAGSFIAFHGDDDPYVSLVVGRELADPLAAQFIVIGGGGHLNAAAGFIEFPQLLSILAPFFDGRSAV